MASDNPAPVRPLSASQHSGIDKAVKDSFVFDMKLVDAASDFVSGGAINEDFVKMVMDSLKGAANESALQHGVFNAISILPNITISPESKKPPKEKDMNFLNKLQRIANPDLYQEKDMKTILDLYAKKYFSEIIDEKTVQAMKAAEPALCFVRATS